MTGLPTKAGIDPQMTRAINAMRRNGLTTYEEVAAIGRAGVLATPNVGPVMLERLARRLDGLCIQHHLRDQRPRCPHCGGVL